MPSPIVNAFPHLELSTARSVCSIKEYQAEFSAHASPGWSPSSRGPALSDLLVLPCFPEYCMVVFSHAQCTLMSSYQAVLAISDRHSARSRFPVH